jgi:hypothetical protein
LTVCSDVRSAPLQIARPMGSARIGSVRPHDFE